MWHEQRHPSGWHDATNEQHLDEPYCQALVEKAQQIH